PRLVTTATVAAIPRAVQWPSRRRPRWPVLTRRPLSARSSSGGGSRAVPGPDPHLLPRRSYRPQMTSDPVGAVQRRRPWSAGARRVTGGRRDDRAVPRAYLATRGTRTDRRIARGGHL